MLFLTQFSSSLLQSPVVVAPIESWVLCRIFLKKSGSKNDDENLQTGVDHTVVRRSKTTIRPAFYDFMTKEKKRADLNLAPTSSSSGSSGVTQVSSNESEENEESSSCNSLPYFRRKQQQQSMKLSKISSLICTSKISNQDSGFSQLEITHLMEIQSLVFLKKNQENQPK